MKACPGLRSGIDCCASLSFAIRGIPSSIRPPIRHSGEGRNPEGVGRGETTRRWTKPPGAVPFSSSYCGLRKATVIPAGSFRREHVRTPIRGRNPGDTRAPPTCHQHTPSHCNPAFSGHNLRVDGRATSNCVLYPRSTASVKTILGRGYQASNPVDRTSVTARRELAHPDEDGNELNSLTRSTS